MKNAVQSELNGITADAGFFLLIEELWLVRLRGRLAFVRCNMIAARRSLQLPLNGPVRTLERSKEKTYIILCHLQYMLYQFLHSAYP
jgi:hypothetical protein